MYHKLFISISAFLFFLVLQMPERVTAQFLVNFTSDSSCFELETYAGIQIESASISNQFANTVFQGGFISNSIKESNQINSGNYFRFNSNYGLNFRKSIYDSLKRSIRGWGINFRNISLAESYFPKDLYYLVFNGNANYEGKTAILNNFRLRNFTFQEIGFSLYNSYIIKNQKFTLSIGINALKGQRYYEVLIEKGDIYTHTDGEFLDVNLNYAFISSDTNNIDLQNFNGTGYSINLLTSWESNNKKTGIIFSISDLGKIFWNQKSIKVNNDTSFRYSGTEVFSILDFGTSSFQSLSQDSLMNEFYYSKAKEATVSTTIPSTIKFIVWQRVYHNILLNAGIVKSFNSIIDKPLFFGGLQYVLNDKINFSGNYSYSQFTSSQVGFSLGINAGKHFFLNIETANMAAFIIPANTFSSSLFISLKYRWN